MPRTLVLPSCRSALVACMSLFVLVACGPSEDNNTTNNTTTPPAKNNTDRPTDTLDITGSYASLFGTEEISTSAWGDFSVEYAHNEENWVVLGVPMDAEFNPGTFSYVVYTEPAADGSFYYCTAEFALESVEAARASTMMPDASMPDTGGCGGFPWTKLEVNGDFELIGEFTSEFGDESITAMGWTTFGTTQTIVEYNNVANKVVRKQPSDAQFNPDTYNRIVWLEPEADGSFYYCTEVIATDTAEAAWMDQTMADASDPDNGGCGGFPWTKLMVK